jgi:hypothetical protein
MQLTNWLLTEVALLLIGLTKSGSLTSRLLLTLGLRAQGKRRTKEKHMEKLRREDQGEVRC